MSSVNVKPFGWLIVLYGIVLLYAATWYLGVHYSGKSCEPASKGDATRVLDTKHHMIKLEQAVV